MLYKNRLAELRGNVSQAEFAEQLGLSQQNYWKYENGKQGMRSDLIEKVCTIFGCSAEWLLGMTEEPAISKDAPSGWVPIPLFGRIAAGEPMEMDSVENSVEIPAAVRDRHGECFALTVEGESMNRVLPNGCHAVVERCDEVDRDGAPYAVCVNGYDATIKRVRRLENGFELAPDSDDPTFRPKVYDYGEEGTETVTIIGRVVYHVMPYDWEY